MIKTDDRKRLVKLFSDFEDSVLISYAEGRVGQGWCDEDMRSGMINAGDFYFVAGEPTIAQEAFSLAEDNSEAVFMPANDKWIRALLGLGKGLVMTVRNRTDAPKKFDVCKLETLCDMSVFSEYKLEDMSKEYYEQALEEVWSRSFVCNFLDYNDFSENAFAKCLTRDGRLICAASCYSSYSRGVEVEIATHPEHRRKGLATVAGAAFVLECVKRGLNVHWDAANKTSLKIAEKLGFKLAEEYTALCFPEM